MSAHPARSVATGSACGPSYVVPRHERRALPQAPEAFEDGQALWAAVCEHELEGVVAKRLQEPYLSGQRGWVKVKNRAYWRWELEREGAIGSRERRAIAAN